MRMKKYNYKRKEKYIVPTSKNSETLRTIINNILKDVYAFCDDCNWRKEVTGVGVCGGYDNTPGKPICELLDIFRKYQFAFRRVRED